MFMSSKSHQNYIIQSQGSINSHVGGFREVGGGKMAFVYHPGKGVYILI